MKNLILIEVMILIIMFCSCSPTRVYTTGSYGSLKSYTEKQHYVHAKTIETYASGDLSFGKHEQDGGDFNDTKTIIALNIHKTTTGDFYNYYYGLGATFGTYKFKKGLTSFVNEGETQKFYTVNLKLGINYTYTRPKVDWRFIGVELSYLNEFGPYQHKLSYLASNSIDNVIVVNQKSMINYQFYSEYVFKTDSNSAFTIGLYVGDLMNFKGSNIYSDSTLYSGITLGLSFSTFSINAIF